MRCYGPAEGVVDERSAIDKVNAHATAHERVNLIELRRADTERVAAILPRKLLWLPDLYSGLVPKDLPDASPAQPPQHAIAAAVAAAASAEQQLQQQQTAAAAATTNDAELLAARGDNRSERMQHDSD